MTEEEYFRKNYPNACYGDRLLSPYWDYFQEGVEFGERESEKKIEELTEQNTSLLTSVENLNKSVQELEQKLEQTEKDLADYQFNYPTIKELQKENEELRKTYRKQRNKRIDELQKENAELKEENQKWKDEWQEQVQKATDEGFARTLQTIQLSKAKEIIKNLMVYVPVDLKEYEEAKQFISEVDK